MTLDINLPHWLDIAEEIARRGGEILKQFWGGSYLIQEKGTPGNLVTEVDKQAENLIVELIKKNFPTHQIVAEESGQSLDQSEFLWVIDPLDGTTNYVHQYPMIAVSIGLLHKKAPLLGVVYNPITKELFKAAKGLGTTLNGQKVNVSHTFNLTESLLGTGFAYDRRETANNNYKEFCHFTHLTQGVRRGGSASLDLAYVAAGRLDGYWERGLSPWDIAAGIILVNEAGGCISDYNLDEIDIVSGHGQILATNAALHNKISQELMRIKS